jgi:hypothetical protein
MKQKRKAPILLLILCLLASMLYIRIRGPVYSGSAVADLTEALEGVYGSEYAGKAVENGTEDMHFEIESKTFLRLWNLRQLLGLDCRYECRVVFTTHMEDGTTQTRTIIYQAVDPMQAEEIAIRASIDWASKTERSD